MKKGFKINSSIQSQVEYTTEGSKPTQKTLYINTDGDSITISIDSEDKSKDTFFVLYKDELRVSLKT